MSNISFDTMDALLSGYVAGSLPKPIQVLISAQLELSSQHRSLVNGLEGAAGAELEELEPVALANREHCLAEIFGSDVPFNLVDERPACDVLPSTLQNFVGFRINEIPWKTRMPGFKEYELGDIDGCHVSMFWIKPGRTVPMHTHDGKEISLIIQGAFTDERGRFGKGDISIADENVDHRPTAEPYEPCIGFAVTDEPLRLTGSLTQRIGDILGAN